MNLSIHDPWGHIAARRQTRDARSDQPTRSALSDWAPAVDIQETAQGFVIHADIPGVDPEAIDITMDDGRLTSRGERSRENTDTGAGYKRTERQHGTFYRSFSLPDTADAERISASSKHGVLEIVIPKQEKSQPRRVQVQH